MTTTSAAGRTSTVTLDGDGRVATVQPPSGLNPSVFPAGLNPVTFHYDDHGRNDSITTGERVVTFGFDLKGYLSSITDPLGRVTSMTNDAVGRPTASTEPNASQVLFSYDASSNVSSVTPPGKPAHLFSYDLEDEETQYTPPDVGTPMSTVTSYNLDRQVTLVSRPDGDFITPQYDATTGRLQSITTAVGQTTFGYKTTTGQLQSIAAPGETLTYGYDGALLTSVSWSGAVSATLTRTYDTSFRVASETVATVALLSGASRDSCRSRPNGAFAMKRLLVALAVLVSACWTNREIRVPAGYKGWIVVRFGDKRCSHDDVHFIEVTPAGVGCLRREYKPGYFITTFSSGTRRLRQTNPGGGGEVWGEATSFHGGEVDYLVFIGTENEFNSSGGAPLPPRLE